MEILRFLFLKTYFVSMCHVRAKKKIIRASSLSFKSKSKRNQCYTSQKLGLLCVSPSPYENKINGKDIIALKFDWQMVRLLPKVALKCSQVVLGELSAMIDGTCTTPWSSAGNSVLAERWGLR